MTMHDIPDVDRIWQAAFAAGPETAKPRSDSEVATALTVHEHLLQTDPGGSFVAELDGALIGIAQAHRRGRIFTLSRLAVDPASQSQGVGRRLLEEALAYGSDSPVGYIFSSDDSRALYRYVRAGFAMAPTVRISPRPGPGPVLHSSIRTAAWSAEDMAHVDRVDEELRGATRRVDVERWRADGHLLLRADDGYVVLGPSRVTALGANSVESAEHLLRAALSGAPDDTPRGVGWVPESQQWAIRIAAEIGASFEVHGAVMSRGVARFPFPYLPNGLFA